MPKNLLVASLLTLAIMFARLAYAQDATPPLPTPRVPQTVDPQVEPSTGTVTAILVKSWGDNPVWADLNTNWSTYGTIPVSIDHTTLIDSDFTYADLVASKADMIIISDAAGGIKQYSTAEIDAIAEYSRNGHPILATFATFEYSATDNTGLAPVFGLNSTLTYDITEFSNAFDKVENTCLLNKIPDSWQSNGYDYSQLPSSGTWTGNLGEARPVADADTYVGVLSLYTAKTYTGIYVSNMPEYMNVGGDDEQLLYNAITCFVKK